MAPRTPILVAVALVALLPAGTASPSVREPVPNHRVALVTVLPAGTADEPKELMTLKGVGGVRSLNYSPDGKVLASAGRDGVKLWEVKSGKELLSLEVKSVVAFSPDGRTLAFTRFGKGIVLWDVESQKERAVLAGHKTDIKCLAVAPKSNILASVSFLDKEVIRLIDTETGKELVALSPPPNDNVVDAIAFSPDGKFFAAAGRHPAYRGSVEVWKVETWKSVAKTAVTTEGDLRLRPRTITFTPDSTQVLCPSASVRAYQEIGKGVYSWSFAPDGPPREKFKEWDTKGHVQHVAFSPDGRWVAFANGKQNSVELGRWPDLQDRMVLEGHEKMVTSVAFSPDSKSLASGSADGSIKLWVLPVRK